MPGGRGQYFARYDTNGDAQVATAFGGPAAMPWAAAANASGVYVSGDFDGYSYFGNDLIAAPVFAQNDLGPEYFTQPFVAKFDRNGNPLWARNGVSSDEANFRGIAAASDGVWAAGFLKIANSVYAQFGTNYVDSDGYFYFYGFGVTFFWTEGGLLAKIAEAPLASPVTLLNPQRVGTNVQFSFFGAANSLYTIQTSTNLASSNSWSVYGSVTGSNATQTVSAPIPSNSPALFFRVQSD